MDVTALILGGAAGVVAGAVVAVMLIKMTGGRTIGAAKVEADRLIENAKRESQNTSKQLELDFRNEVATKREVFEKEIGAVRNELKENEKRLEKREDNLDRKLDMLTTKEKSLENLDAQVKAQQAGIEAKQVQIDKVLAEQKDRLLQVANMTEEQAKTLLLTRVEDEVKHECGKVIEREVAKAEEEAKERAQKITLTAIQRYASEHTAASTVSAIPIESDDLKGRVIGREGRNIRAFEKATGVDVIVDDTPGVIVVSCFDPVRRAIAAESLQRLIEDGRIHPTRIEEIVEKVRKEMDERLIKFGKDACIEANIRGLHPKLSETMGRLYYRTSYGQNILRHSMEVAYLCQVIADELKLDGGLARRCGFLHDIGKALDHEQEGGHPAIGMEIARKYGEKEEVLNAIGGHHNDIPITTPYTVIVMAADAISGARPGARRETLERYVKRLADLELIATSFEGVTQAFAIQAGREVRVIVDADKVDDAVSHKLARDIANRVETEMTYPGEVRVTVLREVRAVEYAR
jgi:ribonuclease Y